MVGDFGDAKCFQQGREVHPEPAAVAVGSPRYAAWSSWKAPSRSSRWPSSPIGAGLGASAMFTSAQMQHPLVAPGAGYYLITAAGIAASLAIIAATFPLLRLITGPQVARNQ